MPKYVKLIAFLQKLISKEHIVVIMKFQTGFKLKSDRLSSIFDIGPNGMNGPRLALKLT